MGSCALFNPPDNSRKDGPGAGQPIKLQGRLRPLCDQRRRRLCSRGLPARPVSGGLGHLRGPTGCFSGRQVPHPRRRKPQQQQARRRRRQHQEATRKLQTQSNDKIGWVVKKYDHILTLSHTPGELIAIPHFHFPVVKKAAAEGIKVASEVLRKNLCVVFIFLSIGAFWPNLLSLSSRLVGWLERMNNVQFLNILISKSYKNGAFVA